MPFLGKSPADGNHNVMLDAITTSATATYNLTKDSIAYTPISAQSLMVSLNGVTQAPISAYTVSGSTIVFASALTSNDAIDYIIAFEGPKVTATLDDNTVTTAIIKDSAVTTAKIADNAITSAKIGVDVIVAEDLAANSITVSEITDGAVSTAKVADDAITLAKMAAGTDGQIITYDASGNPVAVGPGTDGQVLTSTGAGSPPAFENAAGGGGVDGITSSADGTAMTIDSSERIVMPSQPMFSAHSINAVSGGSLHTEASYVYNDNGSTSSTIQAVSFKNILVNVGSCWNNSTGVFTVPVAGRYFAYFNNNYNDGNTGNGWPGSYMMQNANARANSYMNHTISGNDEYFNLVVCVILDCAVNDKIWPGYHSSYLAPKTAPNASDTWGYNTCTIYLLG